METSDKENIFDHKFLKHKKSINENYLKNKRDWQKWKARSNWTGYE